MQSANLIDEKVNPSSMMTAFKEMIKFQLQAENERILGIRPNSNNYDAKYNKLKEIPDYLE